MNVLWLDDSFERTKIFRSRAPFSVLTKTAQECIDALKSTDETWDIVFLDHDLGGKIFVDVDDPNTGSEVVRWIVENLPKINKIIVHSCNVCAAEVMVKDLNNAGYSAHYVSILNLLRIVGQPPRYVVDCILDDLNYLNAD
jgi:hypothetical protein